VLLLLPMVGAIERFVLMKASTSASVILFLRCKIREINLAAGKKGGPDLLEIGNEFLEKCNTFSLELSSQ
jgi:hypothetical protein